MAQDRSTPADDLVFIAGGGGFLGQAAARALLKSGRRVVSLGLGAPDAADTDRLHHFDGLIDRGLLAAAYERFGVPGVVLHAAGGASVGRSWQDPRGDFEMSVGSTAEVLDFLRHEGAGARLVLVSSAAVYGAIDDAPRRESDPGLPMSPYGSHKQVCEQLACNEARMTGLGVSVVRFFSLYGDGLRKQLLWDLLERLRAKPDTLELWGDGGETRDFLHVDDAAALLARLCERTPAGSCELYNGACGAAISVRHLAERLLAAAGAEVELTFNGKFREGDPRHLVADTSKATEQLDFAPRVALDDGLRRYVDWFHSVRGSN
ncbi:MAG: NAD-dependent epimerase/dehydratase family protein [Oceanicaulis sp.]